MVSMSEAHKPIEADFVVGYNDIVFFFIIETPIVYSLLDSLMWSFDRLVWLLDFHKYPGFLTTGSGKTITKRNLGRKELI